MQRNKLKKLPWKLKVSLPTKNVRTLKMVMKTKKPSLPLWSVHSQVVQMKLKLENMSHRVGVSSTIHRLVNLSDHRSSTIVTTILVVQARQQCRFYPHNKAAIINILHWFHIPCHHNNRCRKVQVHTSDFIIF